MTGTPRLFYALWPDGAVREALSALAARLPGRPAHDFDLHLTLAFLGAQPADSIAPLTDLLQRLPDTAFTLRLDRLSFFAAPRVAWAGCSESAPELLALVAALRAGLDALGVVRRAHAQYTPHVTLARDSIDPAGLPFTALGWRVTRMGLAVSDPQGAGARYRILAERALR